MSSIAEDLRHGWRYTLARRAKLLVFLVTAAGFLVTNGFVHGQLAEDINIALSFAGAFGVHQVRNTPAHPSPRPHD